MALKDQILAADDLGHVEVSVPEWDGVTVYVCVLTSREKDAFEAETFTLNQGKDGVQRSLENIRARALVLSLRDGPPPDGQLVFDRTDADKLAAKSGKVVTRLFGVWQDLNGVTDDDVDELAGNSDAGPSDGSPTD